MIPTNVKQIMQKLIDNKFEAYIVGGAVRDTLLGLEPKDWDIFTNATGEDILKIFPQGKVIGGEERQAKILTVIVDGVEVSQYRKSGDRTEVGTTLKDHIMTCDLTINAIAMNIDGEIIDYVKGRDDLEQWDEDMCHYKNIIKFVGNPQDRINEDPLRILRAIRFLSKYKHAEMEHESAYVISDNILKLKELPIERIREELLKILNIERGIEYLTESIRTDIFQLFIPEFIHLLDLEGGRFHDERVGEHSINAFNHAKQLTDNQLIHLACLFHDIGKQKCEYKEDGEIAFPKHEVYGSEMIAEIMGRLKFSEKEIKYVSTMIKHHMMGPVDLLHDRTVIKIVNELEDAGISVEDMLIMTYSDMQANLKKPRMKFNEFYQANNWLRRVWEMKWKKQPFRVTDLEIDGNDVMKLGYVGKDIGTVLKAIFEKVVDGELKNERGDLLNHLKVLK